MDLRSSRILSVCSGVGGLDLGVRVAVPTARTVCFVEHEAFAAHILATRMEEGSLDPAPIWTDLHTFDGRPWRGAVDSIVGGYPCQPFSAAGKRLGAADPRHLWPEISRLIQEIQPRWCFFENVRGHLTLGFEDVWSDLRRLGYRVEAGLFSAEEVGASHRRERLFILAVADRSNGRLPESGRRSEGRDGVGPAGEEVAHHHHQGRELLGPSHDRPGEAVARRDDADGCGEELANSKSNRSDFTEPTNEQKGDNSSSPPQCVRQTMVNPAHDHGRRGERGAEAGARAHERGRRGPTSSGGGVADAGVQGLEGCQQRDPLHGGRHRQEAHGPVAELCCPFAPGPSDPRWPDIVRVRPDLAPATQPGVRLLVDGMDALVDESRVQQLRATGNGVVPLQAAYALATLARKIGLTV